MIDDKIYSLETHFYSFEFKVVLYMQEEFLVRYALVCSAHSVFFTERIYLNAKKKRAHENGKFNVHFDEIFVPVNFNFYFINS